MLLQFSTGSQTEPDKEDGQTIIAAIYFMKDGTWSLRTQSDADESTLETAKTFMEFIFYAKDREDTVQNFLRWKKKTGNELMDTWRRDNIRLVEPEKIK